MKTYYIKVFERWEYGTSWGYSVSTNNVEQLRADLKRTYDRFTIEEV